MIMVFRADEAARTGRERAVNYLLPHTKGIDNIERARDNEELFELLGRLGPAVEAYPSWHPLVRNHDDRYYPVTIPNEDSGYKGLDHTRFFVNGFISCPYGDGQSIIDSVKNLPVNAGAIVSAERLNLRLYNSDATPILVMCHWDRPMEPSGTIPLALAMPLLLERELPCWRWSKVAETWDSMLPYFLGTPHGRKSSLFVSQETGQAMKKIWEALINTGMYGPIKV